MIYKKKIPRHNVLCDHNIIQVQVTQWSEVGRLPLRLLSDHLAAEVSGHDVSLGLVRDYQVSGCRLEEWNSAAASPSTITVWRQFECW